MPRLRRTRRFVALTCAAALAVGLAACSPEEAVTLDVPAQVDAALPSDTQAQLQAAVERAIAASGSSGAVVGVWVPWAGTWVTGLGSVQPDGSNTSADATFKAGYVTRAMTCDVLYGLAADGVVALDDSVTEYVPGLTDLADLTLSQLCDSTTGLGSYSTALSSRFAAVPERVWNPRELVGYGIETAKDVTPGTTFADADTNYALLGIALERASKLSASELYEKYVFGPLGMTASALPDTSTAQLNGLYSANAEDGSVACDAPTDVTDLSPSVGFTASGVISDLTDLGRYTQALATGARPYDVVSRFADPMPASGDAPSWFTAKGGTYQAGTLIGQYGSIPGYLTAAFADQNTGMTIVVALNNSRASATLVRSLAWQLASIASKTPAASGQTAPDAGLPWTAEDMGAQVDAAAVCPLP
ncbi:MAG: serine hydrolase [Microbacterium sp. SCN 70-200]|nr:beta-lactamase family protein [Microbacterium sp.]ODT43031.1 MAG: serine hydrolase [Microbacterium sp. SCN 70-200]OJV84664.1 MAG: serine hydrolase [Microbacterium sp. 70-16]